MADGGGGDLFNLALAIGGIGTAAAAAVVAYQQYLTRWQLKSSLFDRRFENFQAIDDLIRKEHIRILNFSPRADVAPRPEFYEEFASERWKAKFLFGQKAFNAIADVEVLISKFSRHVRSEAYTSGRKGANETQKLNHEIEQTRKRFREIVDPELSQYLTSFRRFFRTTNLYPPFL